MQTEVLDQQNSEEKQQDSKFPNFLLVLLILTSLNVGYSLFNSATSLISFSTETEQMQVEISELLSEVSNELDELPDFFEPGIRDFFNNLFENYFSYTVYSLIFYLMLGVAVILMFNLKKIGYHLYVILQILTLAEYFVFFGFNWITVVVSILSGVFALTFIFLYRANRHHLR